MLVNLAADGRKLLCCLKCKNKTKTKPLTKGSHD